MTREVCTQDADHQQSVTGNPCGLSAWSATDGWRIEWANAGATSVRRRRRTSPATIRCLVKDGEPTGITTESEGISRDQSSWRSFCRSNSMDASTLSMCRRRSSRSTCATRSQDVVLTAWCSAAQGPAVATTSCSVGRNQLQCKAITVMAPSSRSIRLR
jgi:hypothetical protein